MELFDNNLFFTPNRDIGQVLFYLGIILIVILLIVIYWCIFTIQQQIQIKSLAWKRFEVLGKRYALNNREINYLRRLLKKAKVIQPSRYLLEEIAFNTIAEPIEAQRKQREIQLLKTIRKKLFGQVIGQNQKIRSTYQLRAGTKIKITHQDYDSHVLGQIMDQDDNGLIVVIPSSYRSLIPLRPNTRLEVTALISKHQPVVFNSKVKAVIPGPKKMLILTHSTYVVEAKRKGSLRYKDSIDQTMKTLYKPNPKELANFNTKK